jgi:hypothetical protein
MADEHDGIRGRKAHSVSAATALDVDGDVKIVHAAGDAPDLFGEFDHHDKKPSSSSGSNVQAVVNWWNTLRLHFGDALLLQIFFVYFTQGIRSTLCSLGTSYYLNETLALKPAQSEALRGTAAIPWIIKPLYGILSDTVPIWGTRRKSYLLIFSGVAAAAYLSLSVPGLVTRCVIVFHS